MLFWLTSASIIILIVATSTAPPSGGSCSTRSPFSRTDRCSKEGASDIGAAMRATEERRRVAEAQAECSEGEKMCVGLSRRVRGEWHEAVAKSEAA